MSYYFTTSFLTLLEANWVPTTNVRIYLFPQAPLLSMGEGEGDEELTNQAYVGIDTVPALIQQLGWGTTYIRGPALPMSHAEVPDTDRHVISVDDDFQLPEATPTTQVMAVAFAIDNGSAATDKIMFVTDTSIPNEFFVNGGDAVIPAIAQPMGTNLLFYWDEVPVGSAPAVVPNAVEGTLLLVRAPPPFEAARTQHVWIYPQRVNLIANPSFEFNTNFWRSNGSIAMVQDAPPGAGNMIGRVTGTAPLVLESDIFPLRYGRRRETGLTMQLQARGSGTLKIGLVTWEQDFLMSRVDWGHEPVIEGETSPSWKMGSGFSHFRTLRDIGEGVYGMLRLEFKPSDLTSTTGVLDVDQVCVEPGTLPYNFEDWPYFDGDSEYGAKDDFSWYAQQPHASYSCWYNLRNSTFGRLFAWKVDPSPNVLTDEEAAKQGMAYQWVPAGTPIVSHLDVLFPEDPSSPLVPWTGALLKYRVDPNDLQAIVSPW